MTERTWAGTYEYTAPTILPATTFEQVQDALRHPGKVRALGTRHSFNDLADTTGTLVSVVGVPFEASLDEEDRTVTVTAGTRYGVLASWLDERGWALHNLGSLPHISIAGAIATGTHGSGVRNGVLSTQVRGIEYLDAAGEFRTARQGDADFDGMVVHLGAYGILTRLTLAIQPSYQVRQDIYRGLPWDALLGQFDDVMSAGYSVSVFTTWDEPTIQQVWRKTLVPSSAPLPDEWLGALRDSAEVGELVGNTTNLTLQGGVPGPWLQRLPHFRLEGTPSNGDEIQTEYFVPYAAGPDAIRALRPLASAIAPHLLVTELRTAAADTLWLSGAYQRDAFIIHFTWKNEPDAVRALLPQVEAALRPFEPRPHWGKWNAYTSADFARVHPRLANARELFDELDPEARFSNSYLVNARVRSA